jgi:hypothetical protein
MKAKELFFCCLLVAVCIVLGAQQQTTPDKGRFDIYPQLPYHQSKLDSKGDQSIRNIVWSNGCESSTGWTLEPNWQVGVPMLGPQGVPQGQCCLATNLYGFYLNDASIYASSSIIQLPAASYVELQMKEWFEFESDYDFGYVEVQTGSMSSRIDARTGTSGGLWRETYLNLTRFQGQQIILKFHLTSDESVPGLGWYLDDLKIEALEPLPVDLHVSGVNISNLPSVYLTAAVNSPTGYLTDLSTDNFSLYENNDLQENLFSVITPDNTQQISTSDIVFVLDVTSSMTEEINSVRSNMLSFMTYLNSQNIDYRIGFVVFGDIVYVYNQYSFYTSFTEIMAIINAITLGEHGIGTGTDWPENQLEAMAEAATFNWRPGASRVMIMLTDANAHAADYETPWTPGDLLAQRLIPNNIVVFPIFDINSQEQQEQYIPIAQETNQNGTYFDIYDNFNAIIQEIGVYISSLYTVHYISPVPTSDPMTRIVKLVATVGNNSSESIVFYLPGISPSIERSPNLITFDQTSVPANSALNINVIISDRVAPYLQEASLYWRRIGMTTFSQSSFVSTGGDLYMATIPANQLNGVGIEYYILASDGQTTVTLPTSNPRSSPFSIAINPNLHAAFSAVNAAYSITGGLQLNLNCSAASTPNLTLYYRPIGSLVYQTVQIPHGTGIYYSVTQTEDLGSLGVQYYIVASQTNQLRSYYGNFDDPLLLLSGDPLYEPHNINHCIRQDIAYPNPVFSSTQPEVFTQIRFTLDDTLPICVEIFNLKGQRIRRLANKVMYKGEQILMWDFLDDSAKPVGSGLYMYRINSTRDAVYGKILYAK